MPAVRGRMSPHLPHFFDICRFVGKFRPNGKRESAVCGGINPVFTELIHLCDLARKASGRFRSRHKVSIE